MGVSKHLPAATQRVVLAVLGVVLVGSTVGVFAVVSARNGSHRHLGSTAADGTPAANAGQTAGAQTPVVPTSMPHAGNQPTATSAPLFHGGATPSAVVSRTVPAFASSTYYPASYANDNSFDTLWRSQGAPAWLAYDLSRVAAAQRANVLVVWYNESYAYDHTISNIPAYNMPQDYTIDVNAGAGGGTPPSNGWVTRVTVTGNHYHSREHLIDMTGSNWIRLNVTSVDGASQNYDASVNMDVYDASTATGDSWILFGDSITAGAMGHSTTGRVASFAQLINAQAPKHYPVQEAGGIGYLTSADGAKYVATWLQLFPGRYVGLNYGTNDANACLSPSSFRANYVTMIQAILHAGKTPVVPHIPWGRTTNIQNCAPALNAQIDALYAMFPQVIKGPDLWAFFQTNQVLISSDNIHPTNTGFGAYRQQWANAMLKEVYSAS